MLTAWVVFLNIIAVIAYGTPYDSVQILTSQNFSEVLEDPANGLFLIKFFAPWCGHCKALAPILEEVAPLVKGKMAIGTVDCTVEKALCNQYNVKSFPTLKFYRDGVFHDYPGGRKSYQIIGFARKMSLPAVQPVDNYDEALKFATDNEPGVAFLLYDKAMKGNTLQEKLQSTLLAQVFNQVARKQQSIANFVVMQTEETEKGTLKIPGINDLPDSFIAKIESNVDPLFWDAKDLTSYSFISFMTQNNFPLVSEMGPSNFYKIGKVGKSLVIGCVNGGDREEVMDMEQKLRDYAKNGPSAITSQYYFGYMDGILWKKFLEQFLVTSIPQIFVLHVPTKTFYQNETFGHDVKALLEAIDNGILEKKGAFSNRGWKGIAEKAQLMFFRHLPYSLVGVILLVAVIVILIVPPAEELRPPYRNDYDELQTETETFDEDDEADENVANESKKDK